MRTLTGFCVALLFATGLYAQRRSGYVNPPSTGSMGSVLRPGVGMTPGGTRSIGSVLTPGSAIAVPNTRPPVQRRGGGAFAYPVAVPVYVGGYGYGYEVAPEPAPVQPQQPNVIVVYPPAPAYQYAPPAQPAMVEVPREQLEAREERVEPTHYLIAFKDKSIYSAVAYWVDGDTIHYFTAGNTHNQASVSLIDRALTRRLNEGALEVKLPPEK